MEFSDLNFGRMHFLNEDSLSSNHSLEKKSKEKILQISVIINLAKSDCYFLKHSIETERSVVIFDKIV